MHMQYTVVIKGNKLQAEQAARDAGLRIEVLNTTKYSNTVGKIHSGKDETLALNTWYGGGRIDPPFEVGALLLWEPLA